MYKDLRSIAASFVSKRMHNLKTFRPNVGGAAAAPIGPAVAVKPEQEDQFGVYEKFVTIFSKNSVHHLHDNVNTKFLWRI